MEAWRNMAVRKRRNLDMTHGPLLGKILLFSVPVMLTSLLQVAFNAADVIVVGQFAGYSSLAAVDINHLSLHQHAGWDFRWRQCPHCQLCWRRR